MTHWGKEELQERVKSGTVKARKDPQDSRYWQFKACQEHEAVEVERKKEARFEVKKKAEQKEVTDVWKAKHLEYLTEDDFNLPSEDEGEGDEDSDELPAGLAEALGTKSNKEKKDKKEKKEKKEKKDKWEEMTEVQEGEGPQKVKDRLMAFKVEAHQGLGQLGSFAAHRPAAEQANGEGCQASPSGGAASFEKGSPQSKPQKGSCD